jgi:hypothetical protein
MLPGALYHLKMKKLYEKLRLTASSSQVNLARLNVSLENASINKDVFDACLAVNLLYKELNEQFDADTESDKESGQKVDEAECQKYKRTGVFTSKCKYCQRPKRDHKVMTEDEAALKELEAMMA